MISGSKLPAKVRSVELFLVDLSAAFDLVSPSLLIQKLKIYGFEDDIINWLSSYLTDRFQAVWIDHVFSSFLSTSIGVPQWSNLGPLLFLLFFNDLPGFINEDIDCYADDSTLGATAPNVVEIGRKLTIVPLWHCFLPMRCKVNGYTITLPNFFKCFLWIIG